MIFFQNLKIKYKLTLIIMSSVIISLLFVGSVLILSEHYNSKQSLVDKLRVVSKIIADQSTAALSFDDQRVATEVLSALEYESSAVLGCMYDDDGNLFASYANEKNSECHLNDLAKKPKLKDVMFELSQPVLLDGEKIGIVYVRATFVELNDRIIRYILLVLGMISFTGVVAFFMAQKQQALISKPILELAKFARKISTEEDYTIRMPPGGKDEIGALNLAFNDMLEQIYNRQVARDTAVQALSEREQDLHVTLNSIGDAVIVTNLNGEVTRMNPVAERLTGWLFEEAQGLSLKVIFPIIDASTRETIVNPVEKVIATGETVFLSNHTTLIAKNGTELQIADSAAPIRDGENQILGMILVFNDVTEQYKLRESAAKNKRDLQAIMDNSPAFIHVEDTQGRVIFINKQFESLFESKPTAIIGGRLSELFPDYFNDEWFRDTENVFISRDVIEVEEVIPHGKKIKIYSSVKFPLFDEDDNVYAVCRIATDITEKRSQEEQLWRSQKMDALGKLTGGIAHDYNNLLGIILGYADLLKQQFDEDSKSAQYATQIELAADRGTKLTNKLLAFTRHKSTDTRLLDINLLLEEQRLMLEKTLTARVNLILNKEDHLWLVWIDSGDLGDAIINMSINASHAIEGVGDLTLSTKNKYLNGHDAKLLNLDKGEYVVLSILDTGQGMDDATKEKIFDPFFTTKGERGTGLGLSQVYGFVKRSGGEIKVNSKIGQGTQFELYFPRNEKSDTRPKMAKRTHRSNVGGDEIILIVDDEDALVKLSEEVLSRHGYKVLTAKSASEALNVLETTQIDLLISDVIMPGMDGFSLAKIVEEKYPNVQIQMASGFSDESDGDRQDSPLHKNMIYKPYLSSTLLSRVRELLDGKKRVKTSVLKHTNKPEIRDSENSIFRAKEGLTEKPRFSVLILDDDENICNLFELNLNDLGYKTFAVNNGDDAVKLYERYLNSNSPIDALILDLNIPGSIGGREVSETILKMNKNAKIIICSGDSSCSEMTEFERYGFVGSLDKTFNRVKIKRLFKKIFIQK